jgi:hypothetical protein
MAAGWYELHWKDLKSVDPLVEEFIRHELRRHGNKRANTMLIRKGSGWSMGKPMKLLTVCSKEHDLLSNAFAERKKGKKLSPADEELIKKCVVTIGHEHAHDLYNHTAKQQLLVAGMMYGAFNFAQFFESNAQKPNGLWRTISNDVRAGTRMGALWYGFVVGLRALSRKFEKDADEYALNSAPSFEHVRAWGNYFKKEAEITACGYDEGRERRVLRAIYQFSNAKQPFSGWLIEQKKLVGMADALALETHPPHHDRVKMVEKFLKEKIENE